MKITIKGQEIAYRQSGSGAPLLLLHGWGTDSKSFNGIIPWLSEHFCVYALDFCGFGESPAPQSVWDVSDYADMTAAFIEALGLQKPIILGHSFGGRVALYLGSRGIGKKLLLVDAAGVRPKRSLKYYLRVYSYKAAKKVFCLPLLCNYRDKALKLWQSSTPSSDYKNTSGIMRGIFVKVVNEDLCRLMPQITIPTLLIYGENDTATPVSDGRKMESLIPGSGLVVVPQAGHYSFIDQPRYFRLTVESFLGEDMK